MSECKKSIGIVSIYFIDPKDVKTMNPLKMKRKYGKFQREVFKLDVPNNDSNTKVI